MPRPICGPLQVDEDVTNLEALTARYQQQTGRFPSSFSELEAAGMLRGTPRDPLGQTYKLMPDGRVELRTPDNFPFIEKGTPARYEPPLSPKILAFRLISLMCWSVSLACALAASKDVSRFPHERGARADISSLGVEVLDDHAFVIGDDRHFAFAPGSPPSPE